MSNKKGKDATKKINIITLIFGVLMGLLTLPIISLFPSDGNLSFWQYIGYLFIYSILVRLAIYLFQKILIKKAGKNYNGDAIDTRFFSNILYTVTLLVVLILLIHFVNDDGWFSSILAGILLTVPALIINIASNGSDGDTSTKTRKISATTWNYGRYKETTYRDDLGNKVGTATSFDWGPVTDTTIKDKNGNKTKIEHWKF